MANNYTSKDIKTLESIEAIRLSPGMYIGDANTDGLHHLLLEVISNSIDEYLNGHADKITIEIKHGGTTAIVTDNGRGIPFGKTEKGKEALKEIATSLHSGGKFGQGGYSVSGGLHGIGLTAVNALSAGFTIQSTRDNQRANLYAEKGIIKRYNVDDYLSEETGTKIVFLIDPEIFGDAKFDLAKVEKQVSELSYLTPGLHFYVNSKLFLSKNGLSDMIEERVSEPITSVINITGESEGFLVDAAFQFENKNYERVYAFTNNIPNRDGGTHVTGFKSAFTNSINKLARQHGLLEEKDKNLGGDMLRRGMTAAVSIKMSKRPVFKSQTKDQLMTAEARSAVSKLIMANFEKAISRKDLKTIVDRALIERKAEEAAKRSREAAKKMAAGGKDMKAIKDLPSKLSDCEKRNGELWLLEGDSAGGNAKSCRNPETQAILPLRGKVLNTFSRELADIIKNREVRDIMTALGTGVADRFNINNLRYSKIIILADADSDGAHINVLILTLFIKHLPELIKQGKVYMALPPLYKVTKGKASRFFYSDADLERSSFKGETTRFKGIGEMNAEELWRTTMDPERRKLIQLTTDNFDETMEIFNTLMGKSSALRREFIEEQNLLEIDADFYGEEIE